MFPSDVIDAIKSHAIASYPNESCGLIINGTYVPRDNVASDPTKEWRIRPQDYVGIGDIQAVVHSHPEGPNYPSQMDMEQQIASGLLFGIVSCNGEAAMDPFFWGPGVPMPPLIGRDFRHGPSGSDGKGDCYALCKDWYLTELGIELPEVPRDNEWWLNGGNLYGEFRSRGFIEVDLAQAQYGDGVICAIRSKVPNHAGIYLGNGLVIHHLQDRLSVREPVGRWVKHVMHVVRHQSRVS